MTLLWHFHTWTRYTITKHSTIQTLLNSDWLFREFAILLNSLTFIELSYQVIIIYSMFSEGHTIENKSENYIFHRRNTVTKESNNRIKAIIQWHHCSLSSHNGVDLSRYKVKAWEWQKDKHGPRHDLQTVHSNVWAKNNLRCTGCMEISTIFIVERRSFEIWIVRASLVSVWMYCSLLSFLRCVLLLNVVIMIAIGKEEK